MEVNKCKRIKLEQADAEMTRYLNKSAERYSDDPEIVDAIKTGQSAWKTYANKHCNSVFTKWRGGSIRTAMTLDCQIRVTKQRTHQLWLDYLNYMDSTKPDLPEPTRPEAE